MSSPLGGSLGKFFAATKYAAFPPYSKRDSIKPKAKGSLHLASASARELKNYILRYFTILYCTSSSCELLLVQSCSCSCS